MGLDSSGKSTLLARLLTGQVGFCFFLHRLILTVKEC